MTQSRQLAAIMFTDIVGYTAMMGRDSVKAMEIMHISKDLQRPLVEKHNGKWLKEMGDGAMAQFSSALDAVNCAIEIQKSARAELDAKLRIGIHLGDLQVEENDVHGDGVNVASRLESIADPGGIYISESIEKAIQGQTGVQTKYLGEVKLKNVAYGVRTYAVQGVGLPVPEIKHDQQLKGHFWAEVQRRGMVRAGVAYLVVGLLSILFLRETQGWETLPDWSLTALVTALIAGFPIAMYFAWNYERSPVGFVKTTSQQSWQNPYPDHKKKPLTSKVAIGILLLALVGQFVYNKYWETNSSDSGNSENVVVASSDKTIAVLPFKNDSPDKDNQYFCDGMMDEILNHLQKIAALGVKSRTAVEIYRDSPKTIAAIGGELDVAFILEGAVRKYGERFRITTQLIEVKSGNHLWSETYDGVFSDTIFVVQANIAKNIASSMSAVITPAEERRIDKKATTDIIAFDLILRGTDMVDNYSGTGDTTYLKKANDLFDQALVIDPKYSRAYWGKGHAYLIKRKLDSAIFYADEAIELDPEDHYGYHLKGSIYAGMGKSDLAIEYLLKAVELGPNNNWSYMMLGVVYFHQKNDIIKGLAYMNKALRLGGRGQAQIYGNIGGAFLGIGDYEKAKEYFRYQLSMQSHCIGIQGYSWALNVQGEHQEAQQFLDSTCQQVECEGNCSYWLFRTSLLLNEFEKAERYFRQYQDSDPGGVGDGVDWANSQVGIVYYRLGKTEEAQKAFTEQIKKDQTNLTEGRRIRNSNYRLAGMYAFQGDKDKALKHLAEYAKLGFSDGNHDFILIDPFFESLRDDPEFKAIVKKAQDEKAALRAQVRQIVADGLL